MFNKKHTLLAASVLLLSSQAQAGYSIQINDQDTITFGGYLQGDVRYVDGNVNSYLGDFWIGNAAEGDISSVKFSVASSRLNTKYTHGDITGFVELDFYTGEGNQILTNSIGPRMRHAFIKYKNWTVGQTWSTFMNTSALAEAADFGGPLVASAFVRQTQIRYTNGNFQFAIENPESYGGDPSQDSLPDMVGKYTFKGDWGNVAVSAVARQLNTLGGESESALGYGVSGRINTFGKDDLRFAIHGGNIGRYVGAAASTDLVGEEVEDSTSIMVSYRHFWTETLRSNFFYGNTETDKSDRDRTHWGVNIFQNITKELSYGVEFGNYEVADLDLDSDYAQLSIKYVL
ncbi:DcaP family trimeric outer membrane transporter [Thalassotalea ganghwensis]